jgi:thiosulfate/3-mercaptopyruvate sulfurtransferase
MTAPRYDQDATVDVSWIAARLGDPSVRLLEVDVSPAAYDKGHIPGAILWNAYTDLRVSAFRPVPPPELRRLLSRSGFTPDTTIVTHGYAAPLGFWLLKAHGHRDVRTVPGLRGQWSEAGQSWTTEVPRPQESSYPPLREDPDILASRQAVEDAIGKAGQVIVDVRSEPEYSGKRFWPSGATENIGRAGHIPGAVSIPIDSLRDEHGAPRSVEELRPIFEGAGVTKDKAVIVYCTIGNRASEAWLALTYGLGYPQVRVYYDSWAVWGKLTDSAIAA